MHVWMDACVDMQKCIKNMYMRTNGVQVFEGVFNSYRKLSDEQVSFKYCYYASFLFYLFILEFLWVFGRVFFFIVGQIQLLYIWSKYVVVCLNQYKYLSQETQEDKGIEIYKIKSLGLL